MQGGCKKKRKEDRKEGKEGGKKEGMKIGCKVGRDEDMKRMQSPHIA